MHKALVFNRGRLLGRFLCIFLLMIGIFTVPFSVVKGCAEGNLKLDTNVFMNNGSEIGGTGDFSIRGQLFSNEIEEMNRNLQINQEKVSKQKQLIDFREKNAETFNKKLMTGQLFQDYHPQIIVNAECNDHEKGIAFYVVGVVSVLVLMLLGIVIGHRFGKRKRRK